MNILYISEDYFGTKVHHNLCENLMSLYSDLEITIYSVFRPRQQSANISNTYGEQHYISLVYPFERNLLRYKYDFWYKEKEKYNWLKNQVDLSRFDLVFAASLFSEGAIAYKIYKEYGIPYVIAVRGTDIQFYLRRMPHLWLKGIYIIKNTWRIFCITQRIRNELWSHFVVKRWVRDLPAKCVVIPNGVDDVWINNYCPKRMLTHASRILYVGNFGANKNVECLQEAVLQLLPEIPDIHLTLVGGGMERHKAVVAACARHPNVFTYLGKIYNKEKLMEVMRQQHVFCMISHSETFGLVYVEALSQGLPLLYSKGQGIDGVFSILIGENAESHSTRSVKKALRKLLTNYNVYETLSEENCKLFSWKEIALSYRRQFNDIISL